MKKSCVIFHWENHKSLNTPHATKKLLNRWSFTCKAFGITDLIAVTDADIKLGDTEINFTVVDNLSEALSGRENIVFIEVGGVDISDFKHPENATYVFGSDYGGLGAEGAISINTNIALHAEVACGVVLYHRSTQWLIQ